MPTLAESLLKCKVDGCVVYLPPISEGPLENYQEVRKALLNAGAKYKRNTFVFPNDAQPYIDRLVSGESVNIKKEFQFFATPADIAQMMISYLPPVADDAKVCEPEAGDGALIKAFHAAYPNIKVDAFEIMDINRKRLESMSNVIIHGEDFLTHCIVKDYYDIIIANPPFSNNQDIDHIRKMYDCIKPGGTIITLASPSWTFGSQKKQVEFKEWLDKLDVFPKTLPQKSFASSGTNITPVLLQIQKPIVEGSVHEQLSGADQVCEKTEVKEPAAPSPVRSCRICGCTQNDCRQCIEKTGEPCHWVEEDLCSACVNEVEEKSADTPQTLPPAEIKTENAAAEVEETPSVSADPLPDAYQEYLKNRNSSSITFSEMKFFEQLHNATQGVDITLSIKEKNGKYTVMVLPKASDQSKIQPLIVTGTFEELDKDFFPKVGPVLLESTTQLINAEEHKKSVAEATKANDKKATPAPAPSASSKKSKPSKKSSPAKKSAAPKSNKKEEAPAELPKVEETQLF